MLRCRSPFPKTVPYERKLIRQKPAHKLFKDLMRNVKNVRAKSNCGPPKINTDAYLSRKTLSEDYKRFKTLVEDNLSLLERINVIQRTKGRTDTYNKVKIYGESKIKKLLDKINQYEEENFALAKRILQTNGRLPTCKKLLQDWKKNLGVIRKSAKHPIVLRELREMDVLAEEAANTNRPLVFLELAQERNRPLGRLIIVLFSDVVPKLTENFIALCLNRRIVEKDSDKDKKVACIMGSSIYRIFPGLYLEAGDMIHGNGCGGMAATGEDFFPDNFEVDHDCKGTLSMTPNSEGKVNSLFTISFKPLSVLNGKRAAFGRVIKGLKMLDSIQSSGSKNGKPKKDIIITDCGLV